MLVVWGGHTVRWNRSIICRVRVSKYPISASMPRTVQSGQTPAGETESIRFPFSILKEHTAHFLLLLATTNVGCLDLSNGAIRADAFLPYDSINNSSLLETSSAAVRVFSILLNSVGVFRSNAVLASNAASNSDFRASIFSRPIVLFIV